MNQLSVFPSSWFGFLLVVVAVTMTCVPAGVVLANDRGDVEIYCGRRTPPAWDCSCVGDRFDTLSAQYPDRGWQSLLPELMSPDCYSAEQIREYFAVTDCAQHNRTAERLRARFPDGEIPSAVEVKATIVDCACYAENITEGILTLTTILVSRIAEFRVDAIRACPAS